MSSRVNVVVTCTDRKLKEPSERLLLRSLRTRRSSDRLEEWLDRVRSAAFDVTANDLYAGDHWKVSMGIASSLPTDWECQLWVISAGYGLIPAEALIASYGAAFSSGKPDAVVPKHLRANSGRVMSEWWEGLARWEGPSPGRPRTLEALAEDDPSAVLLVSCSAAYLRATHEDLLRAASATPKLFIVSAGARSDGLGPYLVPADARARTSLSGSMMSLNARISRHLADSATDHGFDRASVSEAMTSLLERGHNKTYNRSPMTDRDVELFVLEAFKAKSNLRVAKTPLLRSLRESGFACEQKRFGRIFNDVAYRQRHDADTDSPE